MSARFPRLGVIFIGALALLATSAPPASATTVKAATFVGALTLMNCPGLGHPDEDFDPFPFFKDGPKNEPQINFDAQGNQCNYTLGSTTCVKTSVGKKTGSADICLLFMTGIIWGYCHIFTGVGMLTLVNATGAKADLNYSIKFRGVDGKLFISGGHKTNNVYGVVNIFPTNGSCTNKTARGWAAVGSFTFKTCTGGTITGVCAVP